MKSLLALGLFAATLLPATAAEPGGNQILRQMSDTLAAAPTFRFSATRELDGALLDLPVKRLKAHVHVLAQRPNKFAATSIGKAGMRRFIADGRTLTLFDARPNVYTTVPMPATLDLLVAQLDERFGFTPPLAEFALSDPYRQLRKDAHTVVQLGRETIGGGFLGLGGVECERLLLKGDEADAELWVGVKDHLPRQLVATFKNLEGQPQVRVVFGHWDLAATATPADFAFTPPKGAMPIEMWTVEKMQSAPSR